MPKTIVDVERNLSIPLFDLYALASDANAPPKPVPRCCKRTEAINKIDATNSIAVRIFNITVTIVPNNLSLSTPQTCKILMMLYMIRLKRIYKRHKFVIIFLVLRV